MATGGRDRVLCIHHILGSAGKNFHCNEILPADHLQGHTLKLNLDCSRKCVGFKASQAQQQIDPVFESVGQVQYGGYRIVCISQPQLRLKARISKGFLQMGLFCGASDSTASASMLARTTP